MSKLLIRQVKYIGEKYIYESPLLKEGLNILEGENGSGKTTFSSLVYFGLGGKVNWFVKGKNEHKEIINDKSNYTEILFEINNVSYQATRYFSSNEIHIISPTDVKSLPINRSEQKPFTFSDWLLNQLNIKVVDIYQGSEDHKINFYDLARLFYYDQLTESDRIFKRPDNENYITDSLIIKKAIFEILNGNTFDDYYESVAEYRKAQNDYASTKSLLENFSILNSDTRNKYEGKNSFALSKDLEEVVDQKQKLEDYRNTIKDKLTSNDSESEVLSKKRSRYSGLEEKRNSSLKLKEELIYDYSRVKRLQSSLILEVTQLKKIMITHEKLNLFSPSTCPYCLNFVEKKENECICGNTIDEEQFQKFFYTKEEYFKILKSKQKSIETVNHAIESYEKDVYAINDEIGNLNFKLQELEEEIKYIKKGYKNIRNVEIKEVNDGILSTEKEIATLSQQIKVEKRRESLEQKVESKHIELNEKKRNMDSLRIEASKDMDEIIKSFNEKYYSLMEQSLVDCRSARISPEDYMPIINSGSYKEASSNVSKRVNYFFTLLHISIIKDTNYPQFLMIDTPENIGIDDKSLFQLLSLIDTIGVENGKEEIEKSPDYQMILTTGENKYPKKYREKVFQTISKKKRLLTKRTIDPVL